MMIDVVRFIFSMLVLSTGKSLAVSSVWLQHPTGYQGIRLKMFYTPSYDSAEH